MSSAGIARAHTRGRISVVVPTRDRPALVTEAVRSVVEQSVDAAIEVVVVFDQSRPHPIDVPCPDGRSVRTLVNDRRSPGLAGARNTGILAATGDYVAFCDDDDRWLPGKLAAQLDALEVFGSDAVAATGIAVASDTTTVARPGPQHVLGMADFLRDRVMEVHPSTLLFRRDTLLDVIGLVDEAVPGSYGEDYELLLRAARVRPVLNVAQPMVRVAFHSGSFYATKWQAVIDGLEYILDRYPEFDDVPHGRARIHGQIAFAHAALGRRRTARRIAARALLANARANPPRMAVAGGLLDLPGRVASGARGGDPGGVGHRHGGAPCRARRGPVPPRHDLVVGLPGPRAGQRPDE